jgi:predicted DNA-binding transcriptional regulator AlpA
MFNRMGPTLNVSTRNALDAPELASHSAAASILNAPAVPADLADLQLLDIKAVCALVGLKSSAVQDRVRRGDMPAPIRMGQRCTRWTAGSIKQWLQAQIEAAQDDVKQRQQARAKKASDAAQAKRRGSAAALTNGAA